MTRRRTSLVAVFLVVLPGMVGCAAAPVSAGAPVPAPAPACEPYARTELFFGTSRAGGPPVSDEEFRAFLDSEITPRFPAGLTVLTGSGQFRGADGRLVRERSVVVVLLYPGSAAGESGPKVDEIRRLYREKFAQESVLRVDDPSPPCVSF